MFWQRQFDEFVARMGGQRIPLRLRLWNGFETALSENPSVTFTVPSAAALRHLIRPTLDTLGRAYVEGKLEVEGKLADILQVAVRLAAHADAAPTRRAPRMLRHTRVSDAEVIGYHYDVSNQFYALWLDPSMVYSCGYFRSPQDSLEAAQIQKIDHILVKLGVKPGDRLLDIGCGWGALIMRATQKFGAKSVGITLSRNQWELARERIFKKMRDLLEDGGTAMNHGITSGDPESAQSPFDASDYIERYVFPHGELPHISLTLKEMCAAGLEPVDVENLRRHYALTLTHWAERFESAGQQLRQIAGDKRWRIWRMYLAGCAYAFAHEWMALHQILAVKAGSGSDAVPLTRDYMYSGPRAETAI